MKERKAVYNPEADKKWRNENKEHNRYLTYRRTARMFLRDYAQLEDLEEVLGLIEKRKKELREG